MLCVEIRTRAFVRSFLVFFFSYGGGGWGFSHSCSPLFPFPLSSLSPFPPSLSLPSLLLSFPRPLSPRLFTLPFFLSPSPPSLALSIPPSLSLPLPLLFSAPSSLSLFPSLSHFLSSSFSLPLFFSLALSLSLLLSHLFTISFFPSLSLLLFPPHPHPQVKSPYHILHGLLGVKYAI